MDEPSDALLVSDVLKSLDDVRIQLLNRVPLEYRDSFFTPLHPLEMPASAAHINQQSLSTAATLITTAIEAKQKIVIFGDYDCDGVTATAVMWLGLRELGYSARPFLPRRDVDGYGLNPISLQKLWEEEPFDLLITVDNGIVANEAVSWLREKNVKCIITDHHAPGPQLPDADAIVHSSLLSGVGVAWMLIREMIREKSLPLLDLVVLGTLADQVPLYGANRNLAIHGLEQLRYRARPSLRAIAQVAGIDLPSITSTTITYTIAPRINALGRLADPMDALRALVSANPGRILELVARMEATNQERQELTQRLFKDIQEEAQQQVANGQPVLVLAGPYHEGIIGLLASKLVDLHHRPAIVVSTLGDIWKASCRSVKGTNIIELLRSLTSVKFLSLGGHSQAAGFSLSSGDALTSLEALKKEISEKIPNYSSIFELENIGTLPSNLLNSALLSIINDFQPFGAGNSEPQFWVKNITARSGKWIGKQRQHWKGELVDKAAQNAVPAIFFRAQDKSAFPPDKMTQALVRIVKSSFGKQGFDIQIVDIQCDES